MSTSRWSIRSKIRLKIRSHMLTRSVSAASTTRWRRMATYKETILGRNLWTLTRLALITTCNVLSIQSGRSLTRISKGRLRKEVKMLFQAEVKTLCKTTSRQRRRRLSISGTILRGLHTSSQTRKSRISTMVRHMIGWYRQRRGMSLSYRRLSRPSSSIIYLTNLRHSISSSGRFRNGWETTNILTSSRQTTFKMYSLPINSSRSLTKKTLVQCCWRNWRFHWLPWASHQTRISLKK